MWNVIPDQFASVAGAFDFDVSLRRILIPTHIS